MPTITEMADDTFRDYVTDGVPVSGPHDVVKSEVRAIFAQADTEIAAVEADVAALEADVAAIEAVTGTWTPADASGAALSLTVTSATYARSGRIGVLEFDITYPVTADVSAAKISGLPAGCRAQSGTAGQAHGVTGPMTGGTGLSGAVVLATVGNATTMGFYTGDGGGSEVNNDDLSGARIRGSIMLITAP